MRRLSFALLLLLPWTSGLAAERTWYYLTTGNGHGFQVFDRRAGKITQFLEHPYRFVAPPDERRDGGIGRRDLAHDAYFGVSVDGNATWLDSLTTPSYEAQTHIITAGTTHAGVRFDTYYFGPFGYEGNGMIMLIRARNDGGAAKQVSFFAKPNLKLGQGRVDPQDNGERIDWDGTDAVETGSGGGHALYIPIGGSDQAACGPDADLYNKVRSGQPLGDQRNCQGNNLVFVAGKQAQVPAGGEAWWGLAVLFVNDNPNEPQAADFRDHRTVADIRAQWQAFAGGKDAATVHAEALAEFEAWRKPTMPPQLTADERIVWRQQETVLRLGQVREPTQPNRRNYGMFLAAIPVGEWHTGWVRDGTYGVVAQAMNGHVEEARIGTEFFLNAWAGFFSQPQYLGVDYRISSVRYYGNGKEEGDFNQAGPNVETDGFGLVLWAARAYLHYSCDKDWLQTRTLHGDTVFEALHEVAVDIEETMVGGLPGRETSIWEVHWDYRQVFTYTAATQIRGLLDFAAIARWAGEPAIAAHFQALGETMLERTNRQLVHPQDNSYVSHLGTAGSDVYVDGSTVEMMSWNFVAPNDPIYRGTMQQYSRLETPFGGYRRLEPQLSLVGQAQATEYDLSEWVLLDLRIGEAWRKMGNAGRADQLLDVITEGALANDHLIPELLEPVNGDYAGVVPMVGYGAGAWQMALYAKHGMDFPDVDVTFDHCVEQPMGGAGGEGGAGGAGGMGG
ncbi:MAG: hypothetical protein KC613_02400, partial [Myxococcales bacterium]|nr:hypothetical protein [Myxococcales bacterium]